MLEQGELEILLGVQIVQKSDAESITEMIMDILLQLNIDTGIIIGLVCDINKILDICRNLLFSFNVSWVESL